MGQMASQLKHGEEETRLALDGSASSSACCVDCSIAGGSTFDEGHLQWTTYDQWMLCLLHATLGWCRGKAGRWRVGKPTHPGRVGFSTVGFQLSVRTLSSTIHLPLKSRQYEEIEQTFSSLENVRETCGRRVTRPG